MKIKRAKLLLTAFALALLLFSLFLAVPLPSPVPPSATTPHPAERRVVASSLVRERPVVTSPAGTGPPRATSDEKVGEKTPPRSGEAATRRAARPNAHRRAPDASTGESRSLEATELDRLSGDTTRAAKRSENIARHGEEREGRPPDDLEPPASRGARNDSRNDAEPQTRRRTLVDDALDLERLLADEDSARVAPERPQASSPAPAADLVAELEGLFESTRALRSTARPEAATPAGPSSKTDLRPPAPEAPPRTLEEWEAHRRDYRQLAREEDRTRVSAVFRLEPQDPDLFRAVMAQYRMDILLEIPARGAYTIIPHGGDYWDKTEVRTGDDLRARYGLSVRDLDFPWLRQLREQHVATRLVSAESVDAALLIPKRETEVLLGSIVAGCRSLGHSLEEVSACYGTFVERSLSGRRFFDYVVTRLVLEDGTLVRARRTRT